MHVKATKLAPCRLRPAMLTFSPISPILGLLVPLAVIAPPAACIVKVKMSEMTKNLTINVAGNIKQFFVTS